MVDVISNTDDEWFLIASPCYESCSNESPYGNISTQDSESQSSWALIDCIKENTRKFSYAQIVKGLKSRTNIVLKNPVVKKIGRKNQSMKKKQNFKIQNTQVKANSLISSKKNNLCKYFDIKTELGCKNRESCPYLHCCESNICKFFDVTTQSGCPNRNKCQYVHLKPTKRGLYVHSYFLRQRAGN